MTQRSIQDIVPPARSKPIRPTPPPPAPPQAREPRPMKEHSNSSAFIWIAVGTIVLVAGVIAVMTFFFHTAEARVTVLEWKSDVSGSYSAGGDAPLTSTPVSVSESGTKTVPATGMTDAKDRASGMITVMNLHATKSQRLITNTRFETADGKIYRIHAPVTVPGYTMKGGQKVAGTIDAQVYADQPGESYNTESAEFTLPGLKGSDQYKTITAKTKTPISGGFVGKRATVEKGVRDQAVSDLKAELERTLRERVTANAPQGTVVFPESVSIRYTESPDTASGSEATISIQGTATAAAFPGDALARALAERAGISSDAVLMLQNPTEVAFALGEGSLDGTFTFTLSGTAHLRASFNPKDFAASLAGKSESEAESIRSSFQALTGPLTLKVKPFWLSSMPKNPERITVTAAGALDQ